MITHEEIERVEALKNQEYVTVERDGEKRARDQAQEIINGRREKNFKITSKDLFVELMTDQWVAAEISAAERIMRAIDVDYQLNTRDLIRGELQTYIVDLSKILKRRGIFKANLSVVDFLPGGSMSTERAIENSQMAQ